METELPTIQQIKDACLQHIEEAEAATPGPWEILEGGFTPFPDFKPGGKTFKIINNGDYATCEAGMKAENAEFISTARTMSPAACKCLLLAIEGLEEIAKYDYNSPHGSGLCCYGCDSPNIAQRCLDSIRQEWHNLTTKHPTP